MECNAYVKISLSHHVAFVLIVLSSVETNVVERPHKHIKVYASCIFSSLLWPTSLLFSIYSSKALRPDHVKGKTKEEVEPASLSSEESTDEGIQSDGYVYYFLIMGISQPLCS